MTWQYGLLCALRLAVNGALLGPARLQTAGQQRLPGVLRRRPTGRERAALRSHGAIGRAAEIGRQNPQLLYIRPACEALLLAPLARLPYGAAQILWVLQLVGAAAVFIWLWEAEAPVAALACSFLPLAIAVAMAQDVPLLLVAIAGAAFPAAGALSISARWSAFRPTPQPPVSSWWRSCAEEGGSAAQPLARRPGGPRVTRLAGKKTGSSARGRFEAGPALPRCGGRAKPDAQVGRRQGLRNSGVNHPTRGTRSRRTARCPHSPMSGASLPATQADVCRSSSWGSPAPVERRKQRPGALGAVRGQLPSFRGATSPHLDPPC